MNPKTVSRVMAELARKRRDSLTAEERSTIARNAAVKRWDGHVKKSKVKVKADDKS